MSRDLYDLIEARGSCRSFRTDPIPDEVMARILEATAKSPSGGGFQAISIVKVTDPAKREALVPLSRGQAFLAKAPVSLVFCADYRRMEQVMKKEPAPCAETMGIHRFMSAVIDASIAAQSAVLAAQAEGLGSCYNGNILNYMDRISVLLQLPKKVFPVIMVTLGYPKGKVTQAPKYPASVLVHENTYREPSDEEAYRAYRKQNRWRKYPAREAFVEKCCTMAEKLHGVSYAEAVRKDIEAKGYLGPYQFWFGVYYEDEPGYLHNEEYEAYFKEQGFDWFT